MEVDCAFGLSGFRPVPASAAEFIKVEPTATVGAEPDWEWMHETLKDSGNAQIAALTDQKILFVTAVAGTVRIGKTGKSGLG